MKILIQAVILGLSCLGSVALAQEPVSFNQQIRPILSEYCFACHGPDGAHREADLRLDDRETAVDHGAIVPGDPEESLLVERILSEDADLVMPPPRGGKHLSSEQKQRLITWIQQGAIYQQHWAFEPVPRSIAIPPAGGRWAQNAIDHFVANRWHEKELTANVEADRATWLRRVTFDLTGLPPTLTELEAFLNDGSPDAYPRVVERLLASPAYGERMAAMWLDVARYADTFGYQNDVAMEVWPWRDWVIGAFNTNMPYDQFITEQLAGDLLPSPTQDQRLATTFNRLHRQTNEGGSIPEEFRLAGIADRTTTAATAFLGLTFECSRCHDHKFDPIKQRDFYRFAAFFSDIDELGLYSHFTFSQPTPAMLLYEEGQQARHEAAKAVVARAERELEQTLETARLRRQQQIGELNRSLPKVRGAAVSMPLEGDVTGVVGQATRFDGDQEIVCEGAPEFGRTSPFSFSLWVRPKRHQPRMLVLHQSVAAEDSGFRGLQLTIDDGHPQFSMIHFWPGNAVRLQSRETIPVQKWTHLAVTHDGSGAAAGLRLFIDGQRAEVEVVRDGLTRDIRHRSEWGDMSVGQVKLALGARFRDVGFRGGAIDELHVFDSQLSPAEVVALYRAAAPEPTPPLLEPEMALEHEVLIADPEVRAARDALQRARDREDQIVTGIREIMVMRHSQDARPMHILRRGEYTSPGVQVEPGTPEFLESLQIENSDRLALARWMTSPANPLTSRVIANRIWHLFFGRGIVVTLEDFGSQGTPPSHPQLLDYLARSLLDDDWNLRALCRRIVLSATYRQKSSATSTSSASDPNNLWLARGPKHRLSAEQLRDAALFASGLLVPRIGGSSVMPYQPLGLWREAGTGKTYRQSTGAGLYRRSLYTFWKRTAPPPSMLTFDATNRESCTPRRELTTTPLQALVFLNDPQYVEAARVLAEQLVASHESDSAARWGELFRRLISRSPSDRELRILSELYDEQLSYFREDTARTEAFLDVGESAASEALDAVQLAATSIVVQAVIAYDETIMLR